MPFFVGANRADFPAGTLMLFQQTAAPTGWTKQTTHNDKALRVVSGTAGSGGSSAFSAAFQNQTPSITLSGFTVGSTTLTTAQMPSHTHGYTAPNNNNNSASTFSLQYGSTSMNSGTFGANTGGAGSSNSHNHSITGSASSSAITLAVQYVDLIIASKS